jgi:hypothetical protein
MDDKLITGIVSVLLAIVGVAVIAVLVSNKAQTGSVLGAGGNSISNFLCVALSPVTGSQCGGGSLIPSVSSTISFPTIG